MTEHHLTAARARHFREAFERAGYNEDGLVGTLGEIRLPNELGCERGHFVYLTRRGRPLDTLIRLFLLGIEEPLEAAREALEPLAIEEWQQAGLLSVQDGTVRGLVRIMAYKHLLLASDHVELPGSAERADFVMGITASTATLADSTVRRTSRATLDIGTGSGVQAFLAAPHSEHVCAVDRSPRAIEFARFNASFNDIRSNLEFFEGDGFAPVAGRTFDLIVSNPPFAVTPGFRFIYRDSGVAGDGFAQSLVRKAAAALNEGGLCQMVCEWAHIAGEDWQQRLARWFEGTGCDAWVMRTETQNAADYAHVWIRDTEHTTPEESTRLYNEWLAYYRQSGIESISTGLVEMRKRSGTNWLRIEDAPENNSGTFGESVALGFALRDFLEQHTNDTSLLGQRLRTAASARLDHVCVCEDASWRIRSAKIRLAEGLQYEANIDLRLAGMVALCDGTRTLRDVITALTTQLGGDFDRVAPNCIALTRQLIERGFLLPSA